MKRAKLAILVALAAFALASCDSMLEVLFPEFGSDEQGNFGQKKIEVTVVVGDGDSALGGTYTPAGLKTLADIKVIAVEWSFDFTGSPFLVTSGGELDSAVHNFIVSASEVLIAGSTVNEEETFHLHVPNGVWAIIAFEDIDGDGLPNGAESTAVAQWRTLPPNFPYDSEEFDLFFLEENYPDKNVVQAADVYLVHESYDPPTCLGAVHCDQFENLY